ncbi:acyltransferase [Levilactobacillus brevis]|uniref:acyltransferase n=1 Tax=Levilactobacillus brevis TaxID=1580 RepID=UPI002012B64B|nr:acyltransferase [Levilactobacillus brevis]
MLILKLKFHLKSLFLKWIYRLLYLKKFQFGTRLTFRDGFHLLVEKSGKVIIGNRVFFNNFCSINAMLSVTIGDDCIFGENVKIYDHNHCYQDRSKSISKQGFSTAAIQIGRNCWIGSQVTILKGVTIGDNSIIGAGVVVYQDVPENSIILSNGEIRKYG